ncbi:hypothetical protein GTO91_17060 [Heliobacterium undosum]|uniref:Uncharacterized protein n=1 Tax=Heliomicrobium undosum TaxID=121734 RepID=A0A845L431_9FIRM|nr:DUF6744 family protein [Heliomicrobium undosum]MZP31407.1 hypothetical protein [Heliomicrobium undosum]
MNILNMAASAEKNDATLGYLTWFTVSDVAITRESLQEKFKQAGVDLKHMPRKISPVDAFRRATTAVEKKRQEIHSEEGVVVNVLVRNVKSTREKVVRTVVVEKVSSTTETITYKAGEAKLVYDKDVEDFVVESASKDPLVQAVIEEAELIFEHAKKHYNGRHLRDIVQSILQTMSPIAVRPSGGVYFVPVCNEMELEALVRLLRLFGGGSEGWMIPLRNNDEGKDLVRAKLRDHLEAILRNMKEGLVNDKLDAWHAGELIDNAKRQLKSFSEYQQLLQEEMEDMGVVIQAIKGQIVAMVEKAAALASK